MTNLNQKIAVLNFSRKYYMDYKILPSYQLILIGCGISTKSVVHRIVGELIDDGFFKVNTDGKLYPLDKFIRFKVSA